MTVTGTVSESGANAVNDFNFPPGSIDMRLGLLLMKAGKPDPLAIRPIVFAPEDRHYYGLGADLGQAFSIGKERA